MQHQKRIADAIVQVEQTARDIVSAFGGDVPDYLRGEVAAFQGALAQLDRARIAAAGPIIEAVAAGIAMQPVTSADRDEMAIALTLQGYPSQRAAELAYGLGENDGALQMLARRRIAVEQSRGVMSDRELGTVLGGLRALQNVQQHEALAPEIVEIITDGGTVDPLDDGEIDALCERLNSGEAGMRGAADIAMEVPAAAPRTDQQIVDQANELALTFARDLYGFAVPDGLRTYEQRDPRMSKAWLAACIAFDHLQGTPALEALENLQDGE